MKRVFKKIVDFFKRMTIIELGFCAFGVVVVWGIHSCVVQCDPGYVVTDSRTGECFIFREAEWDVNEWYIYRKDADVFFYKKGGSEIRSFSRDKYMVENYNIPPRYSDHCSK
jgi:hypothetical protein